MGSGGGTSCTGDAAGAGGGAIVITTPSLIHNGLITVNGYVSYRLCHSRSSSPSSSFFNTKYQYILVILVSQLPGYIVDLFLLYIYIFLFIYIYNWILFRSRISANIYGGWPAGGGSGGSVYITTDNFRGQGNITSNGGNAGGGGGSGGRIAIYVTTSSTFTGISIPSPAPSPSPSGSISSYSRNPLHSNPFLVSPS